MQTDGPALLESDFLTSNSVKTKLAEFCFWIQNHKDPGPRRKAAHSSGDLLMALHSDTDVLIRTQVQYLYPWHSCSVTQSCPTLCNPMDHSLPGSSAHGIFQAKILEWAAISSCREYSQPMFPTAPALQADSLPPSHWGSPVICGTMPNYPFFSWPPFSYVTGDGGAQKNFLTCWNKQSVTINNTMLPSLESLGTKHKIPNKMTR